MKKKVMALVLASVMALSMAACSSSDSSDTTEETEEEVVEEEEEVEEEAEEETEAEEEEEAEEEAEETSDVTVMTYAEYAAAAVDDEVVIEAWIQAKQSWWDDSVVVYLQDEDGGYFVYGLTATEEQDEEELTIGTKIRVTGYKAEWAGEVEIDSGATYELVEGAEEYIADPVDVTDIIADEDAMAEKINQKISLSSVTVVAQEDGSAFLYSYDGSGSADSDSDLYFTVANEAGDELTLVIEYYLCGPETDAYQAVQALSVGDVIDIEGFLYWYEGAQPHVTSVTAASGETEEASADGVMTYAEYAAAEVDDEVVIEAWIQAKQSWWDDSVVVYLQDEDGGYFVYGLTATEEQDEEELTIGTKIRVTGYKAEWAGEVEIDSGATYELVEGAEEYIADPVDVTDIIADEDAMAEKINQKISLTGVTVVAQEDGSAFLYAWDGSGSADSDSDLYFTVANEAGDELTLVIEYYLCGPETDAYQAVQALSVGDVIDIEGFLYWYEGAQPHVTGVTVQ